MNQTAASGCTYTIETVRRKTGEVVASARRSTTSCRAGAQSRAGRVAQRRDPGNRMVVFSPMGTTTLPRIRTPPRRSIGLAGELTNYTGSIRTRINTAAASGGSEQLCEPCGIRVSTQRRRFAALRSSAPRARAASGVLLSAVRLASPKTPDPGFFLRVLAVIDLQSA